MDVDTSLQIIYSSVNKTKKYNQK